MDKRRIITTVAVLAAVSAATAADAQVGGLRRLTDKAREAVGTAAGQHVDGTAPASSSGAASGTVPITAELLTRFETGLRAESADRAEVSKLLAPEVGERYRQCTETAMTSPEMTDLVMEFAPRLESAELHQVMAEYEAAMTAIVTRRCGPKPGDPDDLRRRPARIGREVAELEDREYAMLKERTLPFCASNAAGTRVPGDGRNIYFVYSETEVEALRPRCPSLLPLLAAES
jgi:hypothetical protein